MRSAVGRRGRRTGAELGVFRGLVLFLALLGSPAAADRAPARIVSLNLCTDELLLRLVEPSRVSSVTFLARDPNSSGVADLAARVPVHFGVTEDILAQRPDLALAGDAAARAVVATLKRARVPVVEFAVASDLAAMRRQIRAVGEATAAAGAAERLIADIDRRLAALPEPSADRPKALILNPNGFTAGAHSLADTILDAAGFDNLGARLGIEDYGRLSLETVVTSAADLLIVNADRDGPPALATDMLRHPALARMLERTRVAVLPSRLWTCAGPGAVEAIERLAHIAGELRRTSARP